MSVFLLFYLLAYGGVNFYLLFKAHQAFGPMGAGGAALGGWLIAMVASPVAVPLLDRLGLYRPARIVAAVSHAWIAVVFWFFCLALVLDIWNIAVKALALAHLPTGTLVLREDRAFLACAAVVLGAIVWSLLEARCVRLRTVTITTSRLPPGSVAIRIGQISDLHLGFDGGRGKLRRALRTLAKTEVDVLVCTGDLTDAMFRDIAPLGALLREVCAPMGKFAVPGNHEYYTGMSESVPFHEACGFTLLRNQSADVGGRLWLVGIDDRAGGAAARLNPERLAALLPPADWAGAVMVLKHRPDAPEGATGLFDVQLSGHTHGGQIFPFSLIVGAIYRHLAGLYDLGGGSRLYVSRGTGTWGPPMRLLSPPEVTLVVLRGA